MKSELSPTHWLSKIMSASVNSRLQNILKPTRIWKHPELKKGLSDINISSVCSVCSPREVAAVDIVRVPEFFCIG